MNQNQPLQKVELKNGHAKQSISKSDAIDQFKQKIEDLTIKHREAITKEEKSALKTKIDSLIKTMSMLTKDLKNRKNSKILKQMAKELERNIEDSIDNMNIVEEEPQRVKNCHEIGKYGNSYSQPEFELSPKETNDVMRMIEDPTFSPTKI